MSIRRPPWTLSRRRHALKLGLLLGLALALGSSAVAGASPRDSIRIAIPRHIKIGKPYSIKLIGYTSHPRSSVMMVAQRTKCAKSQNRIPGNAGIVFPGAVVTGHFKLSDHIGYPTASHGAVNYCAYLFYAKPPAYREITLASGSKRYRVPS